MRTFVFNILIGLLILGSAYLSYLKPGAIDAASKEIVTLISILSAAVISCIFSVSKNANLVSTEKDKTALFFISNYWIRFFSVCAFCALLTILGKILSWPTISIVGIQFDIIGFLSLSSLSMLAVMMVMDLPRAIRDILIIEEEAQATTPSDIDVPTMNSSENHGDTRT